MMCFNCANTEDLTETPTREHLCPRCLRLYIQAWIRSGTYMAEKRVTDHQWQ